MLGEGRGANPNPRGCYYPSNLFGVWGGVTTLLPFLPRHPPHPPPTGLGFGEREEGVTTHQTQTLSLQTGVGGSMRQPSPTHPGGTRAGARVGHKRFFFSRMSCTGGFFSSGNKVFFRGGSLFARVRLHPLNGQILYHERVSMIVPRFTSFVEDLVICCHQVTELFWSTYCITSAFPARSPSDLGPVAYFGISIFCDVSKHTVFPGCHFVGRSESLS